MAISYQVTKTLLNRLLADYGELDKRLDLHPSDAAEQIKNYVHERIQHLKGMAQEAAQGRVVSSDMRATARGLKLELRAAQRNWQRHLVTESRLRRRQKKIAYFSPNFAA